MRLANSIFFQGRDIVRDNFGGEESAKANQAVAASEAAVRAGRMEEGLTLAKYALFKISEWRVGTHGESDWKKAHYKAMILEGLALNGLGRDDEAVHALAQAERFDTDFDYSSERTERNRHLSLFVGTRIDWTRTGGKSRWLRSPTWSCRKKAWPRLPRP